MFSTIKLFFVRRVWQLSTHMSQAVFPTGVVTPILILSRTEVRGLRASDTSPRRCYTYASSVLVQIVASSRSMRLQTPDFALPCCYRRTCALDRIFNVVLHRCAKKALQAFSSSLDMVDKRFQLLALPWPAPCWHRRCLWCI